MGYERKKLQILGGGFSCLPPADKVPDTDYLLAQNWRSDALGRLISRQGYASIFSIAGAGIAHSAANMGGVASPYYVGCNSGITAPTSSLYYNANTTPIATGFDGGRIGFASQNGFMYVMNRGMQGRHSAAGGWETWTLTPPPASPIVAPSAVNVNTTVAANVAVGAQTVTPATMAGIIIGTPLTISNADLSNSEVVTVTATTGTTFDAVFTSTKTGPGILVNFGGTAPVATVTYAYGFEGTTVAAAITVGPQTVTPVAMGTIAVGTRLGFGTGALDYEIVTVTAVTGTTFDAVFSYAHAGGSLAAYYDYVHSLTIAGVTYSFVQDGYSNAQIPSVMAGISKADPNCSVTWDGVSQNLVITPIVPNTLIPVSGSDANADANLAIGGITSLPNGTYQLYLTFQSADLSLESNPSPVSAAITVVAQNIAVTIPAADAPADARIGFVNIYATGGTLGQAYRVGQVASTVSSPATAFLDTISDAQATNNGQVMPIVNGLPPAAKGIIGPYFSRLYAWSPMVQKNRLYFTQPGLPQYWFTDDQLGDWVDVGLDDEEIVWCSIHGNLLVIYKERTIWTMIGSDPATATLEQVYEGMGLASTFALAPAGAIDYFVGPNGLQLFDMNAVHQISGDILPLFNQSLTNAGSRTPPGSVLPGTAFNSTSTDCYAISLSHALGRLYVSYAEQTSGGAQFNLLVYDEGQEPERNAYLATQRGGRWFYHRNAVAATIGGFFGFFFDGIRMCGLTGAAAGSARGLDLADFRGFLTEDPGPVAIECVYESHYEDCGFPDNDKQWLEIAIDYEYEAGTAANVYAGFNAGKIAPALMGTLATTTRKTVSFAPGGLSGGADGAFLARNMAVLVDAQATGLLTIHNVYFFYYVEARVAIVASTIPTDLGVGKAKECKELELDIDATGGTVAVAITTDLPGNALATRHTPAVAQAGRAVLKYPFAVTLGLLWQVTLVGGPFRLYSARLLMRVIGMFVEAYESAAGFVWDSMETPVGGGDVSTLDQLRFDMETTGTASVTLSTDLPGEVPTAQGTYALATGAMARAWVTVPLPDGIEARSLRLTTTGAANYRLYRVQVRHGHIGRYLAGVTPAGTNDQFRTLEFDLASERIHMFKRIEIDLRVDTAGAGTVTMNVFTNQDGVALAILKTTALATPNGRQTLLVIMPPGVRGRLLRVQFTGAVAARIYKIRAWARTVQDKDAQASVWQWLDFPLEDSPVLPVWMDILGPPDDTSSQWTWVDVPFDVTDGAQSS